jgi:hypothetical protein
MDQNKESKMPKARTVRFEEELDRLVDQFTVKNGLKLNQLVNLAVKKYITEPNIIELEPVETGDEQWTKSMKESFSKHRKSMDELA